MSGFDKNQDWEGNEEEYIQECLEWIARNKADHEQNVKRFEDRYPTRSPRINKMILEALEEREFRIEINEYELGGFIKDYIDKEDS